MRKVILSLTAAFTLICNISFAQLEVIFTGNPVAMPNGQVSVDVSVNDWTSLIGAQFTMSWDSTVLKYNSVTNFVGNPPINFVDNSTIGNPSALGVDEGEATFSWFAIDGSNYTAPDGTRIFTLIFDAVGQPCTSTSITLTDDILPSEAYVDEGNNVTTTIGVVSSGFNLEIDCNMMVDCGPNNGNPNCGGGDTNGVGAIGSDELVASGESVCVEVSVSNFNDIQSFNILDISWDPTLLSFTGTQNYCADVTGFGASNFGTTNAASGTVTLAWFDGTGSNPVNLADGKVLFEICFDAVGANGTFADVVFDDVEFGNSMGQAQPFFTDCGSVEICVPDQPSDDLLLFAVDTMIANGDAFCMPVFVNNFTDVGSFQFNMDWDNSLLTYTMVQNVNPALLADPLFNIDGQGFLTTNWFHPQGATSSLANGAVLFEVCFDFTGDCEDVSPFNFVNSNTVNIEFGDENDQPIVPANTMNGSLTLACPDCEVVFNTTQPSCAGDLGSIQITSDAVSCVWTFNDDPFNNPSGCNIPAGLAGNYCVTVTNSNGDTCEDCVSLVNPDEITFTLDVQNIGCDGNGSITVSNVQGGTGPYTINPASPISVTTPGATTVTVTDSNNCSASQTANVVAEIDPLSISNSEVVQGCNASITLTIAGGCTPYSVTPTGGAFNAAGDQVTFSGLAPGDYTYTVSDDQGNSVTSETFTIDPIGDPTVASLVEQGSCANMTGSAKATITGGCAPYTSGSNFPVVDNVVCYENIAPGDYSDTVTDAAGNAVVVMYTIPFFDAVTATIDVTDATPGMSDGCIDLGLMGGAAPYTITIVPEPATVTYGGPNGDLICGLPQGTYDITIEDANGCTLNPDSGDTTVGETSGEIQIVTTVDSAGAFNGFGVSCNGECDGSVSASVTGVNGSLTSIEWTNSSGAVVGNELIINGLCADTYTLMVTDEAGVTATDVVEISEPEQISLDVSITEVSDETTCDGAIEVLVEGGVGPYTFAWSNGATTQSISDLCCGSFVVIVTDANGCEAMIQNIQLACPETCELDGPCYTTYGNIMTPGNADGVNDFLDICCAASRPNVLNVYDRWGREVHQAVNYSNNWGGLSDDGDVLGEGTYFWVMEVTFDNDEIRIFKGYVTILRDL